MQWSIILYVFRFVSIEVAKKIDLIYNYIDNMPVFTRSKSPQPWNQDLNSPETLLDHIYTDTRSDSTLVCVKIKTTHIGNYYNAIKEKLPEGPNNLFDLGDDELSELLVTW